MLRRLLLTMVMAMSVRYGQASDALYYVVDLSGGMAATTYPVTELADMPSGGWTDEYKTTKLVLRRIEAGRFTMGSESVTGNQPHQVTLTKPFYMGVFEVTQRQWELIMGTRPSVAYINDRNYASLPVDCVSYGMIRGGNEVFGGVGACWPINNAVGPDSFLGRLRVKTGKKFDLPTEAQWEYACRAGTTTDYNNGGSAEDDLKQMGRYRRNSGDDTLAKVGSYLPNAWGLYDMHGNVFEWCLDWYGNIGAATDPKGANSGDSRVTRGGYWNGNASVCMSSFRGSEFSSTMDTGLGFRLAITLQDDAEELAEASSLLASVDTMFEDGKMVSGSIPIAYGSVWRSGCSVTANGVEIVNRTSSGVMNWKPSVSGESELVYACSGVSMSSTVLWRDDVVTYTVSFDANGGTTTPPTIVREEGVEYGALPTVVRTGYTFDGWYTAASGGTKVSATTRVTGDVTLYAHWVSVPIGTRNVSVSSVTAQQRYPWGGLVDVTVTMQGTAEDVDVAVCLFSATNGATKTAISVEHITRDGNDTGSGNVWTRKFIWDAEADVNEVKIDDVALTVDVEIPFGGVQLWGDGPYWAECNVGANRPEECGYYFWWGDTVGYRRNENKTGWISVKDSAGFSFDGGNCPTDGKDDSQLRSAGYIDAAGNLVAAHDAATAHFGAPWRMPTDAELSALVNNCTTTWVTRNGVYGRLVKGKGSYSSKNIFLPAAGYGNGSCLYNLGSYVTSWSSTSGSDESVYVWCPGNFGVDYGSCRFDGRPVRPVLSVAKSSAVIGGTTTHLSLDFSLIGLVSVTSVIAQQQYPWNGLVDVTVTMRGTAEDVAESECLFAATNSETKAAIPVEHITRNGDDTGSGDVWTRKFIWDIKADVGAVRIDDVALMVGARIPDYVQLWEDGPFWAKCNVGATKPEEYGYYFWWGDTVGYKRNMDDNGWISVKDSTSFSFSGGNCPTHGKDKSQLQADGYIDAAGNLVAAHDAATAHLDSPWRMPTDTEVSSLINNCTTRWTTHNGVKGLLVMGSGAYSHKSIFFPAAGRGYDSNLVDTDSVGSYRSSSGSRLGFSSSYLSQSTSYSYFGWPVRPVRDFADSSAVTGGTTTHFVLNCGEASISFNAQGGLPTPLSITLDEGSEYGELPKVTRTGYTFDGWYTAAIGGTKVSATTRVTGDVTLYAHWSGTGLVHRWSFNGDLTDSAGGQSAKIVGSVASNGKQYTLPGGSCGSSYIDLGSDVLPKTSKAVTIEIWATQISAQYYSRIFSFGGSGGNLYMEWTLANFINEDEVWFGGKNFGGRGSKLAPYSLGTEYHISIVMTEGSDGIWTAKYYKKNIQTGETLATYTARGSDSWSLKNQDLTKCYLGQAVNGSSENTANASYNEVRIWNRALTEDELTASAKAGPDVLPDWIRKPFCTITFDANGGSSTPPAITRDEGSEYGELPTVTRAGYAFDGWYTAVTGGTKVTETTKVTGDVTLYARWSVVKYAIAYDLDGGTNASSNPATYTIEDAITLAAPTRSGYTFSGWIPNDGKIAKGSTGAKTFVATWTKIVVMYTISFNANGGSSVPSAITREEGAEYGNLPTVTRTGYTFDGWYTAATGGTKVTSTTKATGDVTLYAHWNATAVADLVHRWSFNGDLADSIGGQTAKVVGSATSNGKQYTLPGGSCGSSYIDLGSDVLPKTGKAVTIEIWATQISAQYYSRIFSFGGSGGNLYMEWTLANYLNEDEVWFGGVSFYGRTSRLAPYSLGTEYHISVVMTEGENGVWSAKYYKKSNSTGETLATYTARGSESWSLKNQDLSKCYLGQAVNGSSERTANASYNEVRIWSRAFTEDELTQSAKNGPDAILGKIVEPIPELPSSASADEVRVALEGSADAKLQENITDAAVYGQYREWAMKIGAETVKGAANSWISFAVDSAALLEKVPLDSDLKIEEFKPAVAEGAFDFTVSVKDVTVGSGATDANLKKVFGLGGTTQLGTEDFDPDKVALEFGTPLNGKLKFTASPKDKTAKSFFMKMKVR